MRTGLVLVRQEVWLAPGSPSNPCQPVKLCPGFSVRAEIPACLLSPPEGLSLIHVDDFDKARFMIRKTPGREF